MARVTMTSEAKEQLEALPVTIHARMLKLIDRLDNWPEVSGAKPLRGKLAGKYRMRTGDYRLRLSVKGERVLIEKIGHRDRFYEG